MSPERLQALMDLEKPQTMVKSDIWSVGCILFLLFFGTVPHNGPNQNKLAKKIIKSKLRIKSEHKLAEITSFMQLITQLLMSDPSDRPDAATVLAHNFLTRPLTRSIVLTESVLEKTKSTLTRHLLLNQLQNYESYTVNRPTIANVLENIFSERPKYDMF
jgi:serine/threonine protein kinase